MAASVAKGHLFLNIEGSSVAVTVLGQPHVGGTYVRRKPEGLGQVSDQQRDEQAAR
jgi:hypothetical protein